MQISRRIAPFLFLLAAIFSSCPYLAGQEKQRYTFEHPQMGTLFRLVFYAGNDSVAGEAAQAAFARIDELNERLSDYLPDSELSRLSALAGSDSVAEVSADLWTVMAAGQELARTSGGAFDLSIGQLTKLWRRAFRQQEFPDSQRVEAARQTVDYRTIHLFPDRHAVQLAGAGARLDAGGIAKGYAADEAMRILAGFGIRQALVDGGGDLRLGDPPPGEQGWRIGVPSVDSANHQMDVPVILANTAVATSGDVYRHLEWEGKRYSHLIDPRIGYGVTHQAQVTVSCPTCLLADGLASAVSILGPAGEWQRLMEQYPDCSVQILFPGEDGKCQRIIRYPLSVLRFPCSTIR